MIFVLKLQETKGRTQTNFHGIRYINLIYIYIYIYIDRYIGNYFTIRNKMKINLLSMH